MHSILADFLLLCVALIWGLTFPAIKGALEGITPYAFLSIRFSIAFLFLALFLVKKLAKIDKKGLKAGFVIGTTLFMGYAFQTIGLQYTTASNAAFITGLAVVLVPLINIPFSKQIPNFFAFLGAISAGFGLGLLSLKEGFIINTGDILVFLCAVSFALHIVLVGKYAPNMDSSLLTLIQIGAVAVYSGFSFFLTEPLPISYTKEVWIGLAICAIPATSLAYLIQNRVQQFTSPTRTGIIFAMEPVFGAIFSYFWIGEILSTRGLVGCFFVLAGILIAEIKSSDM